MKEEPLIEVFNKNKRLDAVSLEVKLTHAPFDKKKQ
jgi:hypothetical protein